MSLLTHLIYEIITNFNNKILFPASGGQGALFEKTAPGPRKNFLLFLFYLDA